MLESLVRTSAYPTDKLESGYLPFYDELFAGLRDRDVRVLELGVKEGASLCLWRDYFERGIIAGIDLLRPAMPDDPRIRVFAGRQQDTAFLDQVARDAAPDGFDIIIDDCSHIGSLTEVSFWHLFRRHLKPGGSYVIEDWGTGYRPDWPDDDGAAYRAPRPRHSEVSGRLPAPLRRIAWAVAGPKRLPSHDAGMVGFVKRLVDECGRPDQAGGEPSAFDHMEVRPGLVVVRKARMQL
jgi:SAM-dependent methyltransferase